MKKFTEYLMPTERRSDFLEWKTRHPDITPEEYENRGLLQAMPEYDFDAMFNDIIAENHEHSLEYVVSVIMSLSKGHVNPVTINKAWKKYLQKI